MSKKAYLTLAAVGAAVIIIAVAFVASGGRESAQQAEKAADPAPVTAAGNAPAAPQEEAHEDTIVWHETPVSAPMTVFKDAADADQTLAAFKGKVLLVNFWATWCAPCVKEMPMLDALEAKLGGSNFQVLAISQDREGAKVAKPFAEKNDWKHLALFTEADRKFSRDAKLRGLPTTLVIDKSGQEVARVEGELNWTAPSVEKQLTDFIAKN
jgi:thiol-disulfide isomerase/thioredoxin